MKIVYIAHPIGGNVEENLADLRRIIRIINLRNHDIVAFVPYYADVVSLNDNIPAERERGIKNDMEILRRLRKHIDELWLTGNRISDGMKAEAAMAEILGIPVKNYIGVI